MHRPATRHPLAVLRRHTFLSSDTALVGSFALLPKESRAPVFLARSAALVFHTTLDSQKMCVCVDVCTRVMSSLRSLQTYCPHLLRLICCVLRWPPSHVPPPSSVSFSLFSKLCPISAPPIQGPHLSWYYLPPRQACTWGRTAAAGFRLRHARERTDLPFLCIDRQIIKHDVPVVFCQSPDRFLRELKSA